LSQFALSGLAGVAVTGGSIATQVLGLGAVLGKLCAMSISFAVVDSLRRGVVVACPA
jgi:hypothetical protein